MAGEYTINVIKLKNQPDLDQNEMLRIYRNGRVLLEKISYLSISVKDHPINPTSNTLVPLQGRDITGDGKRNLVVFIGDGGGNVPDTFVLIIELEGDCRILADFELIEIIPEFIDVNMDGVYEMVVRDNSIGFIRFSKVENSWIKPEVIYSWNQNGYQIDAKLMEIPKPSCSDLTKTARHISRNGDWERGNVPKEIFQIAYWLIWRP